MIVRWTSAIGILCREASPCSKEMSCSFPKRIPFPIAPDVDLMRIPLSRQYRIEPMSIQHTYSHFNPRHSFAPFGLTSPLSERIVLSAFPSLTPSGYPLYMQRRRLSAISSDGVGAPLPNHRTWSIDGFMDKINDLKKSKLCRRTAYALFFSTLVWAAVQEWREEDKSKEASIGPPPVIDQETLTIREMVNNFDGTKQKIKEAFDEIGNLRRVGGLSPRHPGSLNAIETKRGLLELLKLKTNGAIDSRYAIRQDAVNNFIALLKKPLGLQEVPADYVWLLLEVGKLLKKNGQNLTSPLFLVDLVTIYTLLLEKILFGQRKAGAGSHFNDTDKQRIQKMTRKICNKLPNNVEFQYQANKAMALTHLLSVAPEPVTQAITLLDNAIETNKDFTGIFHLLYANETDSTIWWEAIKEVIHNEGLVKRTVEAIQVLYNAVGLNVNAELAFSLRPYYLMSNPSETTIQNQIDCISKFIEALKKQGFGSNQTDWMILCRYVETLSEITLSSFSYDIKKQAFDTMVELITKTTPHQVLHKITLSLLNLKTDPCFEKSVETSLESIKTVLNSQQVTPSFVLNEFIEICKYYDDINNMINSHFNNKMSEGLTAYLSVLRDSRIVTRGEVHDAVFDSFNQVSPDYRQEAHLSILYGKPQIGKTFEAALFVQKYLRDYTYIKWINAEALNWEEKDDDCGTKEINNLDDKKIAFRAFFEETIPEGWLLIIDNVTHKNAKRLSKMIPRKGGHILMIGENPNNDRKKISLKLDDSSKNMKISEIFVKDLTLAAAVAFLLSANRNDAPLIIDRDTAVELAQKYDCNIGDLNIIYNYIKKLSNKLTDKDKNSIDKIIKTNRDASIQRILQKKIPKNKELLSFLSLLNSKDIPASIVIEWLNEYPQNNTLNELLNSRLIFQKGINYCVSEYYSEHIITTISPIEKIKHLKEINLILARSIKNLISSKDKQKLLIELPELLSQCEHLIESISKISSIFNDWQTNELLDCSYIIFALSLFHHYYTQHNIINEELSEIRSILIEELINNSVLKAQKDNGISDIFRMINIIHVDLKERSRIFSYFLIARDLYGFGYRKISKNPSLKELVMLNDAITGLSRVTFGVEFLADNTRLNPPTNWHRTAPPVIEAQKKKLSTPHNDHDAFEMISLYSKSAEIIAKHSQDKELAQQLYENAWAIYKNHKWTNPHHSHPYVMRKIVTELITIYATNQHSKLRTMENALSEIDRQIKS